MRTDIVILNNIDFDSCSNEPLAASQGYAAYHNDGYERTTNKAKLIIGFRIFKGVLSIAVIALAVIYMTTMIKTAEKIKTGEIEPPLDLIQVNYFMFLIITLVIGLMLLRMGKRI